MLPFSLHRFLTSVNTSTGGTPVSLIYGIKVLLPIKVEILSIRVLMETNLEVSEWIQDKFDQWNLIDEKRKIALYYGQLYQKRPKRAFDKKVKPREFKEGDYCSRKSFPHTKIHAGKGSQTTKVYML